MMRRYYTILLALTLLYVNVMAQDIENCYESTRAEGIQLMQKKKYSEAIKFFTAAKDCFDKPANNDLQSKINECRRKIEESNKPVPTPNPPKPETGADTNKPTDNKPDDAVYENKAYMSIQQVEFGNVDKDWNVITDFGSVLYEDKMRFLAAKVSYVGLASKSKFVEFFYKVYYPDGTLKRTSTAPEGYSSTWKTTVYPGTAKTLRIGCVGNNDESTYTAGTYRFELWYKGNKLYTTSFEIKSKSYLTVNGKTTVSTSFSANGGVETYYISTDESWTTWGVPKWCSVEERTSMSFKLKCEANNTGKERHDWMKVKTDNKEVRIDISQSGLIKPSQDDNNYLYVNNETNLSTTFDSKGGTKSFTVSSNTSSWTAWGVPSWCSIENMTSKSFKLSCKANTSSSARSDFMKIINDNKEVRINISQLGKPTTDGSSNRWPGYYWNPYFGFRFAYTQRTFRVTGGGLSKPEKVDFFGEDGWMKGFQAGLFFDPSGLNPWGMFGLNIGLNIEMYFSTWENAPHNYQYEYYDEYMDVNLYMPLDLTFHIPFGPESALCLYGGIGLDFNCYNELTISIDSYANPLTNQYGKDSFNRFNLSYEYGLNLKLRGIMFYAMYQKGLSHHPIFSGYSTTMDKLSMGMSIVFGY